MSKQPEEKAREKIDAELEKRGWKPLNKHETGTGYKEEIRDNKNRPADYVLYINGEAYAIIEAKREEKLTRTHLQQARNYAKHLDTGRTYNGKYSVPFIYSSNGEEIYIDDLRTATPKTRKTQSFYSPRDIKRKLRNNAPKAIKYLQENDYTKVDEKLWENQQEGLEAIKQALYNEKHKMLVSMATGSGKTRLSMALVYQLLESDYANRVLFVPDTKQLERDGKAAFENYNPPGKERFSNKYIVQDFNEYKEMRDGDVVVSTIQKLYTELTDNNEEYSPGEFDIIIADECHRGVYNGRGYGYALDFFDGVEIGLTATPHQKTVDRYNGNHIYEFTYDEALDKDLVVPFNPYRIQTEITMQGIHRNGVHYTPKEIGRKVLVQDTHKKVARGLLEHINLKEDLTLVFAQNVAHADQIAEDFKEVYKEEENLENADEFIKVISSKHQHAEETLEQFKKPRRNPKIAVTVNMVSTGVDVKPLNNLVFLRAIKSKILYNQMMGRGTRKYEGKTNFRVFDCVGILDYYNDTPPFNTTDVQYEPTDPGETPPPPPGGEPEVITEPDIDRIISNKELFPVPNDFVEAEIYLNYVRRVIYDNESKIKQAVQNCDSIQEASDKIEDVLSNEFEFYKESYILKANDNDRINNLFEFTRSLLLMTPSIEENANKAESKLNRKYSLSNEQQKWISKMNNRIIIENETMSKEKLLDPPFSSMGGYDTAKRLFDDNPPLNEVLDTFNKHILSLERA